MCCKRWPGIRKKLPISLQTCSACVLPILVKGFSILPVAQVLEPSTSPFSYILLPTGCTCETHQEPNHCSPPPSPSPQATWPTALTRITATVSFYPTLGVLVVKNPPANARDKRDAGSIPESGRSPGGEHGNSLQYSCLENSMDRGAWQATVHIVTWSWT